MSNYIMDTRRFITLIYDKKNLFSSTSEGFNLPNETKKTWLRYESFPRPDTLDIINNKLPSDEVKFKTLYIPDLLICIMNSKDHSRGIQNPTLPVFNSTEKKVLFLLLYNPTKDNIIFNVDNKDKENETLYDYLTSFNKKSRNKIKNFFYYPGRVVSLNQLYNLSSTYKNPITLRGLSNALTSLCEKEYLISPNSNLYYLNFNKFMDLFDKL